MPETLTFIHAADLHLGAPFRGLRAVSETWGARLADAIAQAYDRVIDAAIDHDVDFVVIAGDVFDLSRPSYGDYAHFFEGLARLDRAGIPTYMVTGNHDPFTSWQRSFAELPPSAVMLPADQPGFALYRRDGRALCLVGGRGYYNQTFPDAEDVAAGVTRAAAEAALAPAHPDAPQAPFAVGVLHTGLHLDPVKAPTDPKGLLRAGMDYWALGHVHTRYEYPGTPDPRLVFSGCIQGRDIKETGEHGVYLVTLRQGAPNRATFIPTASVVWQRLSVDVSGCSTLSDMVSKTMRELFRENGQAHCEQMITRITLVGTTPLHALLARPGVLDDLRDQVNGSYSAFFCDALIDATRAPHDREALRGEGLFPAAVLAASQAQRGDADGQLAYLQDEFLRRNLSLPGRCARHVDELGRQAEDLVLDLLARDEGADA